MALFTGFTFSSPWSVYEFRISEISSSLDTDADKNGKKTVCHLLSQSVSPPPGWLRPQTDTKVRLWSLVRALSISSLPLLISPLSSCFCVCLLKANLSFPPSLHASTTVLPHCSSLLSHNTPPLPPLFPACICLVYSQGL